MSHLSFLLEGETAAGGGSTLWMYLIIFVVLIGFFYFFTIRPQKKQEKKDAEMRDSLAVGDEVTTIGGIIGKVVSIKGETFVLETTKDKTKIRFLKNAVRSVDVRMADLAAQTMGTATSPAPEEKKEEKKGFKLFGKKDKEEKKDEPKDEPNDDPNA